MSKAVSLIVIVLALIALSSMSAAQTTTCTTTLAGGAGNFSFRYCVTDNGNVVQMETPLGQEHIRTGTIGEGYGICDVSTGVQYADYAGGNATNNWLAPILVSASPLVIGRTTSDGLWQLRQTFTTRASDRSIKIKMELKNQAAVNKQATLLRFADIDANGLNNNIFQATQFSAFASNINQTGIQLIDSGHAPNTPIVQTVTAGPQPCTPATNAAGAAFGGNGSLELVYDRTVPKNGTKTLTVLYRPI